MHFRSVIFLFLAGFFVACACSAQPVNLRFRRWTTDDGLSQNTVSAIACDKYGFMWIGTWEGLNRFDGYSFRTFRAEPDNRSALSNNRIDAIVTDAKGNLWIATGDSSLVFRYNYSGENFSAFPPQRLDVALRRALRNYAQSRKLATDLNYLWRIIPEGLLQHHRLTKAETSHFPDPLLPYSLPEKTLNALYADGNNNLWVGTQNQGFAVSYLYNKAFGYLSLNNDDAAKNVIRAVCRDRKGTLWIGTDADGVKRYRNTASDGNSIVPLQGIHDPHIRAILCDRAGLLWVGTKGGLDCYNPATGKSLHYEANKPGSIQHPWVFSLMEDHKGDVWAGTYAGLARYDRATARFTCYPVKGLLKHAHVRAVLEDRCHRLWVATEGGGITCLQRRHNARGEYFVPHHYQFEQGNPNSLINNMVLALAEDDSRHIWIGTNGGLCRLNPENGKFDRYSVANGFPDDLIMGLLSDPQGTLWISHKKGLTCLDTRTLRYRTFTRYDGLQGNEFTQACYRDARNGELFFGGTNGLNHFFPSHINPNRQQPKPVFSSLRVMNQYLLPGTVLNGRVICPQSLLSTSRITLTHDEPNFSLGFSALIFDNPQGCHYKYRLLPFDEEWIYTDARQREAAYTHLPPGLYCLEMTAANSDGIWSNRMARIEIEILPPWWLTVWARMGYLFLLVAIGWMLYRYIRTRIEFRNRLLREQLKNEKNEELMNVKLRFFTDISHEFRTPLTLIIDPLQQLIDGKVAPSHTNYYYQLIHRNAQQLLELINQLLDFRKLQAGNLTLQLQTTEMVGLVQEIAAAFELKAREMHLSFGFKSTESALYLSADADKLRKVLNNLLANAFRFTPPYGKISIEMQLSADRKQLCVEVADTGPGIEADQLEKIFALFYQVEGVNTPTGGSGLGLSFARELMQLHGGDLTVTSQPGKGSCFRMQFPAYFASNPVTGRADVAAPREPEVCIPTQHTPDGELPLLLVVDDRHDIREYIRIDFADEYRIITAVDGRDGLLKAVGEIPDIVISDLMMPDIDGYELCKRLKTDERTSHIPVLLLTARQSDESRIEGYDIGADAYLTKPFNGQLLRSRLRNLLDQRRKLRERYGEGTASELKKMGVNDIDSVFMQKIVDLVDQAMEDPDFDADELAATLKMSRSQLYRKVKALTNRTVHDFILSLRMHKARELLLGGEYSISEVAYKVGFTLPTNFTRSFNKQFGLSPTKFLEKYRK